ncbi:ATP-binding cassette domain-containing protein [Microbacterium sp. KUDC0406]|uniref:ATP-binding cassette domain-containing protein n=1 Tax=Microbacterium sp. KUDC0406 TaxID=2909588 RepID=UPI001F44CCCA|nr:ATP-binding cassette domain-containing protein [Microbacterium sp. KUDC0406]UJP09909.1 ATP-binding cassette domain-containing protein [Microbacterium sp. KUDC0406]
MPEGQVLEFTHVTKRFGDVTALSDFSARIEPGAVTGLLGPNGAGKTTSLRILLGQVRATSGTATIGGVPIFDMRQPLRTIGSVLEETVYRPRRSAARQLQLAAKANGIPAVRVDEVLDLVGLHGDADTRIGTFSLGMRQRLSLATALLGDPGVLVLDEPANGLDPEGIRWMRLLMRRLADEGRTVLVSSHVLSEVEQVADDVVVLSKGQAVYTGGIDALSDPTTGAVIVDAEDRAPLTAALAAAGLEFDVLRSGVTVRGSDAAAIGAIAASAGVALTVLQQRGPSLEEVFLDLVYGRRTEPALLAGSTGADAASAGSGAAEAIAVEAGAGADPDVSEGAESQTDDFDTAIAAAPAFGVPGETAVAAGGAAAAVVAASEDTSTGAEGGSADTADDETARGEADDAAVVADVAPDEDAVAADVGPDAPQGETAEADDSADGAAEAGHDLSTAVAGPDAEAGRDETAAADDFADAGRDLSTTADAESSDDIAHDANADERAVSEHDAEGQQDGPASDGGPEQHDAEGEHTEEPAAIDEDVAAEPDSAPAAGSEQDSGSQQDSRAAESSVGAHDAGSAHDANSEPGGTSGTLGGEDAARGAAEEHDADGEHPTSDNQDDAHDQQALAQDDAAGSAHGVTEHPAHDVAEEHDDHGEHPTHDNQDDAHAAEDAADSARDADAPASDIGSDGEATADREQGAAAEVDAEPASAPADATGSSSEDAQDGDSTWDAASEEADGPDAPSRAPISHVPLPFATSAISLPGETVEPTFTELITGLPTTGAVEADHDEDDDAVDDVPVETHPVFAPLLSRAIDDAPEGGPADAEGDDTEDPRLSSMRDSLAAARRAYFEDPAPAWPYGKAPDADADAESAESGSDPESDEKH